MNSTFADLHVSPTGGGSLFTESEPGSLIGARDFVRTINGSMSSDIVVYLHGGTYTLDSTFILRPEDSGNNGFNVVYKAFSKDKVIISGGKTITGWVLYDEAKNIYRAPINTGFNTRQLFVNGVRANRARSNDNPSGFALSTTGFTTTDTAMQNWKNISDIEIVSLYNWKMFRLGVDSIDGNSIVIKQPCWKNSLIHGGYTPRTVQWIENAYELLNSEGEWYLDKYERYIYYKPRTSLLEDVATATIVAPVLETLVQGIGTESSMVHNVKFDSLTFSYATWLYPSTDTGYADVQAGTHIISAGSSLHTSSLLRTTPGNVSFYACRDIEFTNNTFSHLGAVGLEFSDGCSDISIIGNSFSDISSGGIQIGALNYSTTPRWLDFYDEEWKMPRKIVIQNNEITEIGMDYFDGCGILVIYSDSAIIEHNHIYNVPYSGISLGWGWNNAITPAGRNKIRYNLIHNHMLKLKDGGGIYTLGGQPGTEVSYNYIHHQGNEYGLLYPDEGSSYMNWHHNVVAGGPRWLHMWTTTIQYDTVEYNYHDNNVATMNASNSVVRNNILVTNNNWPQEAIDIMSNAGLEAGFAGQPPAANVALNGTASSSSRYSDSYSASYAVDNDVSTGWSPTGTDTLPWLIVDLKQSAILERIELVTRQTHDQPDTRRNFAIQLSNDNSFSTFVTIAVKDSTPLNYQETFSVIVRDTLPYRYVRVIKTVNEYFFISELRVFGTPYLHTGKDNNGSYLNSQLQPIVTVSGNPGIPSLNVKLAKTTELSLDIYNIAGQKILSVFNGSLKTGNHSFKIGAENRLKSGTYVVRLISKESVKIQKIICVK
jgi:hypothetical protein